MKKKGGVFNCFSSRVGLETPLVVHSPAKSRVLAKDSHGTDGKQMILRIVTCVKIGGRSTRQQPDPYGSRTCRQLLRCCLDSQIDYADLF
jgi:hypothetical protein